MTAALFLLQRASAAVLALAVAVHLATIIYAVRGGLTAGEILARTEGNVAYLTFYVVFVAAVAVHAPIGLRNVSARMAGLARARLRRALAVFALALFALGLRAVAGAVSRMRGGPRTQPGFVAALLHRLSGIALAIFVPFHFIALATVLNGADALDSFLSLTNDPLVKLSETGLVAALATAHGARVARSWPSSFSAFASARERRFRPASALGSRSGSAFC